MRRVHNIETLPPVAKGRISSSSGLDDIDDADGRSFFDAVLYPNRSLPNSGFWLVMSVVIGANLLFGTYFFTIGAWPVLGFCGLDIFAVWLAFKLSYRQGRLRERVRITDQEMLVARVLPSGHETRWRLQPYWTKVHIDRPVGHESQVKVTSKGGTLILGSFLSPAERGRFADALVRALGDAREQTHSAG
ncbi:MAG: DUF2244 domain-containing protein [Pseudomonadota bacterium]